MQVKGKVVGVAAVVSAAVMMGAGTAAAVAPVQWQSCEQLFDLPPGSIPADMRMQCAQVEVPVDYDQPDGRKTKVAVSKIPAKSGDPKSTIFGNPGGPGADALMFWAPNPEGGNPAGLYENHDLVAVQPRGLWGSNPIECNPAAIGPVSINHLHDACYGTDPAYFASMTTENSARDMDTVREAMGLAQIDYLGVSYGTKLGADYATLYPQRVNRMVLDSNVGPNWSWSEQAARTTEAQRARIYDMFQWIADHDDEYHLGDTPLKVYHSWKWITDQEVGGSPNLIPPAAVAADLPVELRDTPLQQPALDVINNTAPARARAEGFGQVLLLRPWLNTGATGMFDATLGATMDSRAWPFMANILEYYNTGGKIPHVDLAAAQRIRAAQEAGPALNTEAAMFEIVTCNEDSSPTNPVAAVAAKVDGMTGGDVLLTGAAAQRAGIDCLGYPPVTRAVAPNGTNLGNQPLVLQNITDAITPLRGGEEMAAAMGVPLVTVPGGGHGAFRMGNKPLDDAILAFFDTGTYPPLELPGMPGPEPLPRDLNTAVATPGGYAPAAGIREADSGAPGATDQRGAVGSLGNIEATLRNAVPTAASSAVLDDWYGSIGDADRDTATGSVGAGAAGVDDATANAATRVATDIDRAATDISGTEQSGARDAVNAWIGK